MRYATDIFVPFFKSVTTGADKKRSARSGTVDLPDFLAALYTQAKELWALKFAPKEALIGNLMDGRLYINAAGYFLVNQRVERLLDGPPHQIPYVLA